MRTTTIYNIVHSELIKRGYNEIIDKDGNLIFFDSDLQFMNKIFSYDEDVSEIVDDLFNGNVLDDPVHDDHFKRNFFYRFINRQINRQTIESFKLELLSTFLMNQDYINRVYSDLDEYITQKQTNENVSEQKNEIENEQKNENVNEQTNKQVNDGSSTTDNRSAFADLPQSSTNLDVNNTVMQYPSENTISRNKQVNNSETDSETSGKSKGETTGKSKGETTGKSESENKSYSLDELFKSNGVLENILNIFDVKCFLQVW